MPNINSNLNYDDAFAALETVLAQLEAGDLPLETALALYEEGVALAGLCSRKLEEAELRVQQWQGGGNGASASAASQTRPFEGWQEQ